MSASSVSDISSGINYMEIFKIAIPSMVSIIGFIITSTHITVKFKNEMLKEKRTKVLSEIIKVPPLILTLFDQKDFEGNVDYPRVAETMSEINIMVFGYGSIDAVKIISAMQSESYKVSNGDSSENRLVSYYVLLLSQIKFDISGDYISPKYWYEFKITDYEKHKSKFIDYNNQIVKKLNLNNKLILKN